MHLLLQAKQPALRKLQFERKSINAQSKSFGCRVSAQILHPHPFELKRMQADALPV
jgi:hypothetical protein